MSIRHALVCAAALLGSCAWSDTLHLMDSGYSIDTPSPNQFSVEVHLNQLKQLGGEVNSAQFRLFVGERLKWYGVCPAGWAFPECVRDGSCIVRTKRSVTVPGRCLE